MRHETVAETVARHTGQAMLMAARAGSPRWSVRILSAFDDPEARAFARLVEAARPGAVRLLEACDEWRRRRRAAGEAVTPLPLLVLNEDGQPVMLLPMVIREHDGLRHAMPVPPSPPRQSFRVLALPDLALSALEARAILRAVMARLPADTDLLTFPLPRPGTHALSWRGLFHLLARRLRGETARD